MIEDDAEDELGSHLYILHNILESSKIGLNSIGLDFKSCDQRCTCELIVKRARNQVTSQRQRKRVSQGIRDGVNLEISTPGLHTQISGLPEN